MTSDTIEASYMWTEEEYVKMQDAHRDTTMRPRFRHALNALYGVWLLIGVVATVSGAVDLPAGVAISTVPLVLLLLATVGRRRRLRSAFRRAGVAAEPDQKISFVIDPGRLRLISACTDSSWAWEVVTKVVEAREGFVIYRGGFMNWLPHHAFLTPAGRERFAALARERAARFDSRAG